MDKERDVHYFWLQTCKVNTYKRSPGHARLDTPWNAFRPDGVLVCTIWVDEIATVYDEDRDCERRFVKFGGKAEVRKGGAKKRGAEADANIWKALEQRSEILGYEAEPVKKRQPTEESSKRQVSFFYMNRVHKLVKISDVYDDGMIKRLGIYEKLSEINNGVEVNQSSSGYLFELIEPPIELIKCPSRHRVEMQLGADVLGVAADSDHGDDKEVTREAAVESDNIVPSDQSEMDFEQDNDLDPDSDVRVFYGGGGESEQHKKLKEYVKNNPELVGAGKDWVATEEYLLKSADEIDVFFKSEEKWIGVEVKSAVSDGFKQDYERGIYQVVKYQAVLEAQAKAGGLNCIPEIEVFLVLQNYLPNEYKHVANSLGVKVIEGVYSNGPVL